MQSEKEALDEFYSSIYGTEEGNVWLAFKHVDDKRFEKQSFNWPIEKTAFIESTLAHTMGNDVYFAPALYDSNVTSTMEHVLGARAFWVELDKPPNALAGIPEPTLKIQSSVGKEHWYWQTTELISTDKLNFVNKALGYILGADDSGWDATQVLRPPNTCNYKYGEPQSVVLTGATSDRYAIDVFDWLPAPPEAPLAVAVNLDKIPSLNEILFKFTLPKIAVDIFTTGQSTSGDRSDTLMQLAYELAKANLAVEDMLCMLVHVDNRIKKFSERDDQLKQLLRIIGVAKAKYPPNFLLSPVKLSSMAISFLDIQNIEREMEWVVEGLIEANGNGMVVGMPGIGKTQFSLQLAAHIAIGKDFLGFKTGPPRKIMFLSLEMDDMSLKKFIQKQAISYTTEELQLMHKNFLIVPLGQPLHLCYKAQQDQLEEMMINDEVAGVFVDSLSRATDKALQDEVSTRELMGWVDKMRTNHKFFFWWIHHNRKAGESNKKPNTIHDIYGSVFIQSGLSSAVCLWHGKERHTIDLSFIKTRLSEGEDTFQVVRNTDTLTFSRKEGAVRIAGIQDYSIAPVHNDLSNFEEWRKVNSGRTNSKLEI